MIKSITASLYFIITMAMSIFLMGLPLNEKWQWFNPEWPLLVLMYWTIRNPSKNYIMIGFFIGLYIDIIWHGYLGVNAFLYAFAMFILSFFFSNVFRKPFFEQVKVVFYIFTVKVLMLNLWFYFVYGMGFKWPMLLNVLMSVAVWPWLVLLLNIFAYNDNRR